MVTGMILGFSVGHNALGFPGESARPRMIELVFV
jgi:hypothetical protein